ncbi:zinc metalloproteinase-disintegrin agkistin isoform X1 [Octopus vulgaris]|uniref:Zinc metalloproteinase-disintegrin agkistin isoform X1 n=1 Tax=Octopus vulgaris TaxID=6645 RepID=A0AA36BIC0_OCTVU|nr:zinc metalloproteinase-disintegrin agkistin isoform X1 [Octopus vulgaris]
MYKFRNICQVKIVGIPIATVINQIKITITIIQSFKIQFKGCNIQNGRCVCSKVSDNINPFTYSNRAKCERDLKGEDWLCPKGRCKHGGRCCQIKRPGGRRTFKCECIATGYYGKRCERKCPKKNKKTRKAYPMACIFNLSKSYQLFQVLRSLPGIYLSSVPKFEIVNITYED